MIKCLTPKEKQKWQLLDTLLLLGEELIQPNLICFVLIPEDGTVPWLPISLYVYELDIGIDWPGSLAKAYDRVDAS